MSDTPESGRHRRRLSVPGVLVAIDAPDVAEQPWVVDAIDLNARGMGLVLPPELPEGTRVFLTCRLDEGVELARVPAWVRHQHTTSGGVTFDLDSWDDADQVTLLRYLIDVYETGE